MEHEHHHHHHGNCCGQETSQEAAEGVAEAEVVNGGLVQHIRLEMAHGSPDITRSAEMIAVCGGCGACPTCVGGAALGAVGVIRPFIKGMGNFVSRKRNKN